MKPPRFSRLLDFLPPAIAFGAAVVAVVGAPKWNDQATGLAKVTFVGWTVFCIGALALLSSLLVTRRNHKDQTAQKALREQIAKVGQDQLLRGLDRVVCVFRSSLQWHEMQPEPESPLDLLSPERRAALAALNLNSLSNYADGKGSVKWWAMFENTAVQGSAQITTALQIYVTFLDPKLIEATTKLLNCEFMHRLCHTHDIIDANIRGDAERPVRFFWVSQDHHFNCGYEEFWHLVSGVMRLCAKGQVPERIPWARLDGRAAGE